MSFISYAQNYEDVMLRRALKDIDKGFYIDVGAQDPVVDSVTKAFYDVGWSGVNIEPSIEWHSKLEISRPNDINLQFATGKQEGTLEFFEIPDTGLSTLDEGLAKGHAEKYGYKVTKTKVTFDKADNLLALVFMIIKAILQGNNWQQYPVYAFKYRNKKHT